MRDLTRSTVESDVPILPAADTNCKYQTLHADGAFVDICIVDCFDEMVRDFCGISSERYDRNPSTSTPEERTTDGTNPSTSTSEEISKS